MPSNTVANMKPYTLSESDIRLLKAIQNPPAPSLMAEGNATPKVRMLRLDEINEESPSAYRQALASVYAALDSDDGTQFMYLLEGGPEGVALYFGVIEAQIGVDSHEAMKNLRGALEGQLPGINLSKVVDSSAVMGRLQQSRYQGLVLGVPTVHVEGDANEEEDFQGIERLVRTLVSGSSNDIQNAAHWQMLVVCQPLSRDVARHQLNSAYDLASQISLLVRTSVQTSGNISEQKGATYGTSLATGVSSSRADSRGKSDGASETKSQGKNESSNGSYSSSGTNSGTSQAKSWGANESVTKTKGDSSTNTESDSLNLSHTSGSSLGITHELTDKRSQHLLEHLEKRLIPRLQKGVTKGLFGTAIYLCADTRSTYRRLKNTVCAIYQGSEPTASPLEVQDLPESENRQLLRLPTLADTLDARAALFHSLIEGPARSISSLLTSEDLALIAGLPRRELPGLRRRKTVDFIVDLPRLSPLNTLDLGEVIDRGRHYPMNRVRLNKSDINKHIFITGVTGAGKTTTCLNLLIESNLPFLVIEPAKTEYRALYKLLGDEIDFFRPNGDNHRSLRLNPFALVHKKQKLKSHASFLRNIFAAVFPMEASMPYLIEQAIMMAYEEKGWDLTDDTFLPAKDPFDPMARAWPCMSDMIRQLDVLIPEQGMGKEFEEKYRGSLVSRLTSLTHGVLGDVLDVSQSLDFSALLQRHVVIELEEIKDGEGKALMMALLLGNVSEAIRASYREENDIRHLTLVEEAHRLLSRPEPGDSGRAMAVEAFADMLAEVRKYGEGLIIADQIPSKLIPDVIKNTHCKIVHRLFAEDDRRTMGEAMMMDESQRDFLPNLSTGEAVIFCGGWHGPVHAAIRSDHAQTDGQALSDDKIEHCAIAQLWRERQRYYPMLTHLGWPGHDKGASTFAHFVGSTRKALENILMLNPHDKGQRQQSSYAEHRLRLLKDWLSQWQTPAITTPVDEDVWRSLTGTKLPGHPLTISLLAVMLDTNPRAHTRVKQPPVWAQPACPEDWQVWTTALDAFLGHVASSENTADFRSGLNQLRDLTMVLDHLGNYRTF